VRELLLIGIGYACYAFVRNQVGAITDGHDQARALSHAKDVVGLERHLGLFQEGAIQRAVLHAPWLMRGLDSFWAYAYLLVTIAVIGWLIARHQDRLELLRNGFLICTLAAVGLFLLFPTAPPRMLPPSYGIVDTWNTVGGIAASRPPRIEHISDALASMPSLHVAWSLWCSIAVSTITKRRWVKGAAWLYTALTILAVIASGNHYFLDCVGGVALMLVALGVAALGQRMASRASRSTVGLDDRPDLLPR
jgi:membrane-associated phospholipid phosphatase